MSQAAGGRAGEEKQRNFLPVEKNARAHIYIANAKGKKKVRFTSGRSNNGEKRHQIKRDVTRHRW